MFHSSYAREWHEEVNDGMDFSSEWTALPSETVLSHDRHSIMFVRELVRNTLHIYRIPFSSLRFETDGVSGTRVVLRK